jgi:tetratricopeptide (TPR) repeat protein
MSKKKILLLGGIGGGVMLLVAFGVLFTWIAGSEDYGPDHQLDLALKLLESGRWDLADRIARDIETAEELNEARQPVWDYVRGVSGVVSTADKLDVPANRKLLWDSAKYLEKSREAGFPLGYSGRGQFYLGYCYYNTYDWDKALETLAGVEEAWPERRSDAYDMMVDACLRTQPPKRQRADELLDEWTAIPGLAKEEQNRITLERAHLAFLDGDWDRCEEILASIEAGSPQYYSAKLGRGRWKLESAKRLAKEDPERLVRLEQALADFREVLQAPGTPVVVRRRSAYLTGETLRQLGRVNEAISTLSGVRQRNPQSAEAIAAGISEAEIQLGSGELNDALETARHVVNDLGDVRWYDERWLPLPELRHRLLLLGRAMREQDQFEDSIRLAACLPPVLPQADAVRLEAETFEDWGAKLEGQPHLTAARGREEQRRQVDAKYKMAGAKYRELAQLEIRSVEYPSIVWKAIECFRKASELDEANELLKIYLEYEERPKRPRGLLALGQNYLNAGRWDEVIPPLQRCLFQYPDHPLAYNVRLVMARALTEKQQLEEATEVLMKNLYDGNLRPDSQLWRDSLFELGNVIYRRGDQLFLEGQLTDKDAWEERLAKLESSNKDFIAAAERLSEAIARFDKDKRSLDARYALGRAFRSAAMFPKQMLDSGQVTIDAVRRRLVQERRQLLESSLAAYRDLREAFGEAQEVSHIPETAQALLRNCFFGEADVLFELERYEEAIDAYRNVGNRFMNEPEALEALVQIADCYRALGQHDQARRTLTQAEQLLSRIPPESEARFASITRADRAKWQQLLAWLKQG